MQDNAYVFNEENYEGIICLPSSFGRRCKNISYRDSTVIADSCFIIFYAEERENSDAYKAYRYAQKKKKGKHIVNLFHSPRE